MEGLTIEENGIFAHQVDGISSGWLGVDLSGAIYCTTMGVLMIQCGLPMIKLCFSYCSAYNEEIDACRSFGISKVLQSVACDFQNVANTLQVLVVTVSGIEKEYFTSSDPHHGIQFIPSDNLSGISIWHSIWHVF